MKTQRRKSNWGKEFSTGEFYTVIAGRLGGLTGLAVDDWHDRPYTHLLYFPQTGEEISFLGKASRHVRRATVKEELKAVCL
jgi:hypothetical protein